MLISRKRSPTTMCIGRDRAASATAVIALSCLLSSQAIADTLTLGDGSLATGTVKQISANQVTLDGQQPVSISNVLRVTFSSPDVVAYPSGLVLTDGTALGGIIRGAKPDSFTFRSVTLGSITISSSDVALLYFGAPPVITTLKAPPKGTWRAVLKNGTTKDGSLVSISILSAILRTPDGLEKLPLDSISCILKELPSGKARVTLRNADRFSQPAAWTPNGLTVKIGTLTFPVGLASLREIQWDKRNQ